MYSGTRSHVLSTNQLVYRAGARYMLYTKTPRVRVSPPYSAAQSGSGAVSGTFWPKERSAAQYTSLTIKNAYQNIKEIFVLIQKCKTQLPSNLLQTTHAMQLNKGIHQRVSTHCTECPEDQSGRQSHTCTLAGSTLHTEPHCNEFIPNVVTADTCNGDLSAKQPLKRHARV